MGWTAGARIAGTPQGAVISPLPGAVKGRHGLLKVFVNRGRLAHGNLLKVTGFKEKAS